MPSLAPHAALFTVSYFSQYYFAINGHHESGRVAEVWVRSRPVGRPPAHPRAMAAGSGGKDSCHNALLAVAHGHELVAVANLHPPGAQGT